MKKLTKIAVLAASAALAAQGAYAAGGNNLILGINNNDNAGSTGNDYEFAFGTIAQLQTTANTVESLGVSSTSLTAELGSVGPAGFSVGVIGGPSSGAFYMGVVDNGTGTPLTPGSVTPAFIGATAAAFNQGTANSIAVAANGLGFSAGHGGTLANSAATSFTSAVAKDYQTVGTSGPASIYANSGAAPGNDNYPMALLGASDKITLDLWTTTSGTWSYVGDIAINLGTGSGNATYEYDPAAVSAPEPSTYGVIAGAGLLALSLSRQLRRKTA